MSLSATVLREDRGHERHEQEQRNRRVYDPVYRDDRAWDTTETDVYRQWLEEWHEKYRDYDQWSADQQQSYWKWHHAHEKHEDRDRDRDRH